MIRFPRRADGGGRLGFFRATGGGDLTADWGQFQRCQMLQNLNNYMARAASFGNFNAGSIMLGAPKY